jgi:hypothetical protein
VWWSPVGTVGNDRSGAVAALTCSLVEEDTPMRAAVTGTAGRVEFPHG